MTGEKRKGKQRITSFGEMQAKYAKEAIEESLDLGENLLQCSQGEWEDIIQSKRNLQSFQHK